MALAFFSLSLFAQTTYTGKVVDGDSGDPLIGASVLIKGSTIGTVTDVDGSFTLIDGRSSSKGQLEVTYLGYQTMLIPLSGVTDLGMINITQGLSGLAEVVVTGTMDIVQDRRTPVAVSTITTAEIRAKSGNVEFPELMKSTPSIYVANQAGGFGDSQIYTRGFDQTNTAFLLNGQPINGMEDGRMYWSNWSGMSDIANAIQVQRGLGSSKLAISSVGGTTNIIMKSTDLQQGGTASLMYGNNNYLKATASYNTGMINDKFGFSFLVTHWQGIGWADGTRGQGQNYFFSAGYKPSPKHNINFLITGAPQWHDQNFSKSISSHFRGDDDEIDLRFNNNWGTFSRAVGDFEEGEYYSLRRNYYHKPVANLNWEYTINNSSKFSTVAYASWGRGGGSGNIGSSANRFYDDDGQLDWSSIYEANAADAGEEEWVIRNSVNNHAWYGMVNTYETKIGQALSLSVGADLRTYYGDHFRELRDLMGAPSYTQGANARFGEREVTTTFSANPWSAVTNFADQEDQIAYSNSERISYGGLFGQVEYNKGPVSVFVQGAVSNQNHVRFEKFNETEATEASEAVNNLGYNAKTGLSYSFNQNHTVFANTGYYQRQPFHDNIYLNFSNFVNPVTVPEKVFGIEGGYKFSNKNFALNFNVYSTSWRDRATTRTLFIGDALPSGDTLTTEGFRNTLQNQLHSGVELDFTYRITRNVKLKGFASVGNWNYAGTLSSQYYDEDRNLLEEVDGDDVDGVKVGGAAQTTFGIGLDWRIIKGLKLDVDYNYYDRLHSIISASSEVLELPAFGIMDLGLSYNIPLSSGQFVTLRGSLYNALGAVYISRSFTAIAPSDVAGENFMGVNRGNVVTFGKTQTWNLSAKMSF